MAPGKRILAPAWTDGCDQVHLPPGIGPSTNHHPAGHRVDFERAATVEFKMVEQC